MAETFDLVVWEAERPADIVAALAPPRLVVKAARITVEHARTVQEPWRSPAASSRARRQSGG